MPLKGRGRSDCEVVDRWPGGAGWLAHPEESMQRASHALTTDDGVWLVDPLDASGVDELVAGLGDVAGVVVTLDRHTRDAAALAERHGVAVHIPERVDASVDAPVTRLRATLGETAFRVLPVVDWPGWTEVALFDGETLVVGDALGTAPYFRAGDEPLAVHPFLRLSPPHTLRGSDPERVLVGHGAGVFEDAGAALDEAVTTARRRIPRAWLEALRDLV